MKNRKNNSLFSEINNLEKQAQKTSPKKVLLVQIIFGLVAISFGTLSYLALPTNNKTQQLFFYFALLFSFSLFILFYVLAMASFVRKNTSK